ncbi:hypothetical protein SAZ10_21945 [Mesorhizobium sp. BAC0120]|uniref:hypothetical protein n=1 Tax=Mesorhizobium sp. BAC0120 TaxID=3090670 RepID=UPI00298D3024|nr:hypothetical protein [Mesorhizobium sp. BAC0120]MDW6024418.1 hypothetical protein [Mesorhizobium sp. BAC0120]
MTTRRERLQKLASVQEKLKAFHEMRLAGFRAEALAAEREANAMREAFDMGDSMSALFPEIYHRRIERALDRAAANMTLAEAEAMQLAAATARSNMVDRAYRSVTRQEERAQADRERLEMILRGRPKGR